MFSLPMTEHQVTSGAKYRCMESGFLAYLVLVGMNGEMLRVTPHCLSLEKNSWGQLGASEVNNEKETVCHAAQEKA